MKEKIDAIVKKVLQFLLNPRLLLCLGIAWIITNGWSYIMMTVGTYFKITWMQAVAGSYLAFLWFPFSPEKLATVAIAIALLRFLFPNDQKTLAVLINMKNKLKTKHKERKKERKAKKVKREKGKEQV